MNLSRLYEIIFSSDKNIAITKMTKKEFLIRFIPQEARLNSRIFQDKTRRSRLLRDSLTEGTYITSLIEVLDKDPLVISRFEKEGIDFANEVEGASLMYVNQLFKAEVHDLKETLSPSLSKYLLHSPQEDNIQCGRILAFLVLLSLVQDKINNVYRTYFWFTEKNVFQNLISDPSSLHYDYSSFIAEYPPDALYYNVGERIYHTWCIKNTGNITWENRYLYPVSMPDFLECEDMIIKLPAIVYPGDTIYPTADFIAPNEPGAHSITYKAKNSEGLFCFPDSYGLKLHFTIDSNEESPSVLNYKDNYRIVGETCLGAVIVKGGTIYTHKWRIQNTGETVWKNYRLVPINCESIDFPKRDLYTHINTVRPGKITTVQLTFQVPIIEGTYCLIWQIQDENGKLPFAKSRRIELHLIVT